MSKLADRTTVYLDPLVKKFLQHKAVVDDSSVSAIINDYFSDMLEDLKDIETIKKARKESTASFEDTLSELGLTYDDLRD